MSTAHADTYINGLKQHDIGMGWDWQHDMDPEDIM